MSLRVCFLGTPEFAATILKGLANAHDVVLVGTRKDAVRGRGSKTSASAVKLAAQELGLEVCSPDKLDAEDFLQNVEELAPDVIVVASYGKILPEKLLALPRLGCVNVHASLLPRWRGAAPIERAMLAGDAETGVCIMAMEAGLDTGPVAVRRSVGIGQKTFGELEQELAALGVDALNEALGQLEAGTILWTPQDAAGVTYAEKLERGELNADPAESVTVNLRRLRASSSGHSCRCLWDGHGMTLLVGRALEPEAVELAQGLTPGDVAWRQKMLLLGCGDGAFEVLELKPDGKRAQAASSFVAGQPRTRAGEARWSALDS